MRNLFSKKVKNSSLLKSLLSKWPLYVICFIIIFGLWFSLLTHYGSQDPSDTFIGRIENKILDWKFLIRDTNKPKSKVGVLAIDEESIQTFGRWPFSRSFYAKSFSNLKKRGVKWIGLDAVFDEPQKPTVEDLLEFLPQKISKKDLVTKSEKSPSDLSLAKSIKDFENIILGFFYFQSQYEVDQGGLTNRPFDGIDEIKTSVLENILLPEGKNLKDYPKSLQAFGLQNNISLISQNSHHAAFFNNDPDADAMIRWVTLVKIIDGKVFPSLALKIASETMNRDMIVSFHSYGIESIELISRTNSDDVIKLPLDPLGKGRLLLNHLGPRKTIQHISLARAYKDQFNQDELEFLNGATLLLGPTAVGINDQRPNPFDPSIDGVENHGAAVDNLVSQNFLKRPSWVFEMERWLVILIGLFLLPLLISNKAAVSALSALLFFFGYAFFDYMYFFRQGLWIYSAVPLFEILLLFFTVMIYQYMTEEQEKKKVKGAFAHYLSPEVIDQVLDDPGQLQLGGVRKDITVFFSDVRNFTTISESLTPEALCDFMNSYFTPMTKIILQSKGVLDKYIGDAIMAFWGAPMALEDQADRAAHASLAMIKALQELKEIFIQRQYPSCEIGIGLNTGPMSVGNMGSGERFCYTVMGDSVNLGSRLESLTKEYGVKIIMSEFTVKAFKKPQDFLYRDLDDIRVKGKTESVKIFELVSRDLLGSSDQLFLLIQTFESARIAYKAQKWHDAKQFIQECLRIHPHDGPSLVYEKRIMGYVERPPQKDWDGVYTFAHK